MRPILALSENLLMSGVTWRTFTCLCRNTGPVVPAAAAATGYGVECGVTGLVAGSYLRHSVGPINAHNVRILYNTCTYVSLCPRQRYSRCVHGRIINDICNFLCLSVCARPN